MPRPQQLHQDGQRRTITFRSDLDRKLRVMAADRRVPISVIVEELLERGLNQPVAVAPVAADFPPGWDGSDLRERLYTLRMRQSDLADVIKVKTKTLNHWVTGLYPYPLWAIPEIQKALRSWKPGPVEEFREGTLAPRS